MSFKYSFGHPDRHATVFPTEVCTGQIVETARMFAVEPGHFVHILSKYQSDQTSSTYLRRLRLSKNFLLKSFFERILSQLC